MIYTKSRRNFREKEFGIQAIPFKATFARVLSAVNGKEIGDAVLDVLRMRFSTVGEVIAVDGEFGTAKSGEPRNALRILSAYVTENGMVLEQEAISVFPPVPLLSAADASFSGTPVSLILRNSHPLTDTPSIFRWRDSAVLRLIPLFLSRFSLSF